MLMTKTALEYADEIASSCRCRPAGYAVKQCSIIRVMQVQDGIRGHCGCYLHVANVETTNIKFIFDWKVVLCRDTMLEDECFGYLEGIDDWSEYTSLFRHFRPLP